MRDLTTEEARIKSEAEIKAEARLDIELELIGARRIDEAIQEAVRRALSVERHKSFLRDVDPLFAIYPVLVTRYGDGPCVRVICEIDDPPLVYEGEVPIYGHPCVAELTMRLEAEITDVLEGAINKTVANE